MPPVKSGKKTPVSGEKTLENILEPCANCDSYRQNKMLFPHYINYMVALGTFVVGPNCCERLTLYLLASTPMIMKISLHL